LKDFNPVSSLLQRHIQRADDPPADPSIQSTLLEKWKQCAGRAAAFTYPILFRSGRLVVFTESPVWATEIRHHLGEIESALSNFAIDHIDVRTSPPLFPEKSANSRQIELSEKNRRGLELCAHGLKHRGLRSAMTNLSKRRSKSP
jgi:hypothetical protein